ncbi:MAG: hypothetical protein R3Y59_04700 [bacterium]
MDFTLKIYKELLMTFIAKGYEFFTFEEYCEGNRAERFVVLRHDVEKKIANAETVAHLEKSLGINASYYFRDVPQSWNAQIIKQIATMGHEVGYHYETLSICNGDVDAAYNLFCETLDRLRAIVDVQTISMHGSPQSKYDNRDIWKKYDYSALGIIGEPYFDTDFSDLFYLTDTGRRWDGYKVSLRDKIPQYQDQWSAQGLVYHSTTDIITALNSGYLPHRLMITTHPQRWTDNITENFTEFCLQNTKNLIKRIIVRFR